MAQWAYTMHIAKQLLWPRRGAQRIVAFVCVAGIALGLMLQIVVRGIMDGMVREIDAGVQACIPELLITTDSGTLPRNLPLPETCTITPCQAGIAATPHGLCRYSTWHDTDLITSLILHGRGELKAGEALISQSLAEKALLNPGETLPLQLTRETLLIKILGIYRVPGRMLAPDILLPYPTPGGEPAIAITLAPGADIDLVMGQLRDHLPEAEIHPTQADTAAWLGIIQRVKHTMGFILYLCSALAAFSCGALLWVICHQRRQELSILAAYGMAPAQLCGIILSMAGAVATCGISLGLPLAWATLHWREEIRQILAVLGIQIFPVEILAMPLPALTTPVLYLMHSLFSAGIVLLSTLPAMRLVRRLSSHAPLL